MTGDPVRLSVCHCLDCKRLTGGAFSWNATYAASQVSIAGAFKAFTRGSDDGFWARHGFCPECGVTVSGNERGQLPVTVPIYAASPSNCIRASRA